MREFILFLATKSTKRKCAEKRDFFSATFTVENGSGKISSKGKVKGRKLN